MKKKYFLYILLLCASIGLRIGLFDYQTLDYINFLSKWVDYYRNNGGFFALANSIGNYNIPYLYFMAFFSYLKINDLYLIKILSCLFDYLLAYSAYKLVAISSKSENAPAIAFFAVLFAPTVVINSALWAQCDSIYVSLALFGIYLALKDRPVSSMIFMALSFGFKLQAVFILPVCILLLIMKKYKVWHFLVFPLAYLVLILPAVLLGRPILSALTLYIDQMDTVGDAANYNAPSFNAITHENGSIVAAVIAMILLIVIAFIFRKYLTSRTIVILSCMMATLIPYFLPHMHDRYFFAADALSIIVVFAIVPSLWQEVTAAAVAAVFQQFASLICYLAYLTTHYLRVGSIYLTNDRGAIAILFSVVIYALIFVFEISKQKARKNSPSTECHN